MARKQKVWDAEKEADRYDSEFYDKHVKYYQKGLESYRNFLLDDCKATSVVDVGCGMGDWIAPLQDKVSVLGIDFSVGAVEKQQLKPENFMKHDLTKPINSVSPRDVVCSLEVYEHIMPEHEDTYLSNLMAFSPRLVVISCAPPGQWGRGHHNPCTKEHVIEKFTALGYEQDEVLTKKFSKLPGLATFYRKNTVVFKRAVNKETA
jgi:SAM-dependent methyltransferase